MISSSDFYAFHRFADLQSLAFSENSLLSIILNHLQTKVTLMNAHFCIFFQHDPKGLRVLTNLIVFSFGLADKKSFNSACSNIFLHFCAAIMDLSIILKC